MTSQNIHDQYADLLEYLTIVEAELVRRRISEREIAHLQKLIRLHTPAFSSKPTAGVAKSILLEVKEKLYAN